MAEERKKVFIDRSTGLLMYFDKSVRRIYWTENMLSLLRRHFPHTCNEEVAGMLGVSVSTLNRKVKEPGLKKDKAYIESMLRHKRFLASVRSKALGYPGSFKKGTFKGNRYTGMVKIKEDGE